jgi:hypothetical protein
LSRLSQGGNRRDASPNIIAQGDGTIACRITVDGVVKDERTIDGVNAQTSCLVKSA